MQIEQSDREAAVSLLNYLARPEGEMRLDTVLEAFAAHRQSTLKQGVRMALEAVSEACEARREGYLGKAAQRDPFADDTMNLYDGSVLCAEVMEYARLDVEALDPMEIIHKATRRRKALEELAEADAELLG